MTEAPPEEQIVYGKPLVFDDNQHAYSWDGKFVPGVTSILAVVAKPALIQWAAGMASDYWLEQIKTRHDYPLICKEAKTAHRRKAKAAADIGNEIHKYAECHFKRLPAPELTTPEAKRGAQAFHDWLGSHKIKIKASERRIFSKKFFYAGTCDLVAEIDGELCVGDLKTSTGIWPEMLLQTAAYQGALEEEKEMKFDARYIIRFGKTDGLFEAKRFTNFLGDFDGFCAALNLHKTLQRIKESGEI